MDPEGAKPSCQSSPSDVGPNQFVENVPVYYHWFGVELLKLHDAGVGKDFQLAGMHISVDEKRLLNVVEALHALSQDKHPDHLDSRFSSIMCRELDRFLFSDDKVCEGACLAQFPVLHSRRPDLLVIRYKHHLPAGCPAVHGDFKTTALDKAIKETVLFCKCCGRLGYHAPWTT